MSRDKIAARQFLSLNCLAITLTAVGNLKEEKCLLLWGRDSLGGIFGDNLGEGKCESRIAPRQWGDNFCRETSRCLAGPSGLCLFQGPVVRDPSGEFRRVGPVSTPVSAIAILLGPTLGCRKRGCAKGGVIL